MQDTRNAAVGLTAAPDKITFNTDYTTSQTESKEVSEKNLKDITRTPIKFLKCTPETIPQSLQNLNNWILWKSIPKEDGRTDKIPLSLNYTPIGAATENGNPLNKALKKLNINHCDGLGFILGTHHLVVVDVDHCIDEHGDFTTLAQQLMKKLPTYVEYSQSQHGLHFIFCDENVPEDYPLTGHRNAFIEIYTHKRYIALTGWRVEGTSSEVCTLNGMHEELMLEYFPSLGYDSEIESNELIQTHTYTPVHSNEGVLQQMKHDDKFQRLFYDGSIEGYPSQSEADGALMLKLAQATYLCAPQMRELFSQSALGKRDKWNDLWYQDYVISGAIKFASIIKGGVQMKPIKRKEMHPKKWNDWTEKHKQYSSWLTGFSSLDAFQILPPSLISLPAMYGMGKTTFAHQLGENVAAQGKPVLFMSFETDIETLHSKSILRRVKQLNPNTSLTPQQIKEGEINPTVQKVLDWEEQNDDPFYYQYVPENSDIDTIIDYLKIWVEDNPEPFIILDYLQYIYSKTGCTTKDKMDYIVRRLKAFIIEYHAIILVLSSVNRNSYYSDISGDSTKESGGIEYTADVSWGLQLEVMEGKESTVTKHGYSKGVSYQEWLKAKSQNPRKMMIRCLKNRFGDSNYVVYFDYYADYDLFVERNSGSESEPIKDNNEYVDSENWRND